MSLFVHQCAAVCGMLSEYQLNRHKIHQSDET